ncbi:substrate-binding domain-containing protein [Cesiribacter sp. SM1]|uniref:hybrid sensor histidine kinase/response regulator transcription factor n=1 Tax=Cesiribacter sp. SM1 TaxID=2861196 RepID=UPI00351CCB52
MRRELSFYQDMELVIKDAKNSTPEQAKHIREFIEQGVDLLIVSPNETDPITPLVEEAFEKGIPVIIVDRRTSSSLYTAYVGANNYEIGKLAGNYVAELLKGRGNIIEVWGLKGSSPAIDRHRGFMDALAPFTDINIVAEVRGEWEKEVAKARFPDVYKKVQDADLLFAHNDVMALGSYEYLKSINQEEKLLFVGVDGLSGTNGGLQFVTDGILDATFLYPTGGEEIIKLANKILRHEPYEKENILSSTAIDGRNVHIMKQQTDKILVQQKSIERQQDKIKEQIEIYQNQRTLLYIMLGSLTIIIILGALAMLALREKQEINRVLLAKNREILNQRNEIEKMARKADKATEAKFKFFTNISHEFRTPLTLILGPVEDILRSNINSDLKKDMQLVKNNANRLLHLVTQLMDFRKIENKKMRLQAAENDIVAFIRDVASSFKRVAQKRRISFMVDSKPEKLKVYFDTDKLDKVLFNLLSNAFKFTPDGGSIGISIAVSDTYDSVEITVEDTGKGMAPEHVKHAFDRFYTGDTYNNLSTGLGLALSKEFISLHKGSIAVVSEKWKGTKFIITLPLGKEHLKEEEILIESGSEALYLMPSLLHTSEDSYTDLSEADGASLQKEHTVLLIEDNNELRAFLRQRLQKDFNVVEAPDGILGLNQAFDVVPDLVISDIMLPNKDGLEVTATLKNDPRTSHIPVVLLTAKDSIDHKIEGIQSGADLYVTKPFSYQYLLERIKNLLRSREKLKEHYCSEIPVDTALAAPKQLEKKFISEFRALVQKNLSNAEFNTNDIAESLGMSRVQVYRKVKQLLGYSVNDYVVKARMKKAKHLLLHTDQTIAEISAEVGFSSPAYFSTAFKNHFGISPSDFKGSHLIKH